MKTETGAKNSIKEISVEEPPPSNRTHGLPNVVSPYLQKLIEEKGGQKGPLGLQFVSQPELEDIHLGRVTNDPLDEEGHSVVPGLVYKYQGNGQSHGRALLTLTYKCASYCRFCTRGRVVGTNKPHLSHEQIDNVVRFIKSRPQIDEIILSGGDPLTAPPPILKYALESLGKIPQLKIIRIGTRLPVHNPLAVTDQTIETIRIIKDPYILIHINHPDELSETTKMVIGRFRRECLATVLSQTVFLKGVNDDYEILLKLFTELSYLRVRPYYLYRNDPVPWAKHLTIPFEREIEIATQLKSNLSGLAATFRYVIDVPGGCGKIEVPLNFWHWDKSADYKDFKGNSHPSPLLEI